MARKVDDLGRIVLPVETRRLFGIHPGDALEIAVVDGLITLRKLEQTCVFCGGSVSLREFKAKLVCGPCADELSGAGVGAGGVGAVDGSVDGDGVDPSLRDT